MYEIIISIVIFIAVIAYLDAIVTICKEAKNRYGADPFTAGFLSLGLTPIMGFLYLLLFPRK